MPRGNAASFLRAPASQSIPPLPCLTLMPIIIWWLTYIWSIWRQLSLLLDMPLKYINFMISRRDGNATTHYYCHWGLTHYHTILFLYFFLSKLHQPHNIKFGVGLRHHRAYHLFLFIDRKAWYSSRYHCHYIDIIRLIIFIKQPFTLLVDMSP